MSDKEWTRDSLRAEIARLQGILAAMDEEEDMNYPHKQLNLFEE